MSILYLPDTGLRNSLLDNFLPLSVRTDKGELWENAFFRILAEKHGTDPVHFWRTASGKEVVFFLSDSGRIQTFEIKYDKSQIKESKYKLFTEAYPEIPLHFAWMYPFDHDFFRRTF